MRFACILCWAAITIVEAAEVVDRYPEIRAIIREAEKASVNIPFLDDRSQPSLWAARLYAQAGYLDDAARAIGRQPTPPQYLLKARVLYGGLIGADQSIQAIKDPEKKAQALVSVADLLWRMDEPGKAKDHFEAAKRIVPQIADPQNRQQVLAVIEQGLEYVTQEPPTHLSTTPTPPRMAKVENSAFPLFPITAEGFEYLTAKETANRANEDSELLTNLYNRMIAGDREGLQRIAETAATPFKKALAIAGIEHILIQAGKPEGAEQYAMQIPAVDPESSLAKAEAFSAAAVAWLRVGDAGRAQTDFDAAINLVQSVRELPLGRVTVMTTIATAQVKGGMTAGSTESLKLAQQLAQPLPLQPAFAHNQTRRTMVKGPYRDDAYKKVLLTAIQTA